jgi:RNA polymerase primary sigma factor
MRKKPKSTKFKKHPKRPSSRKRKPSPRVTKTRKGKKPSKFAALAKLRWVKPIPEFTEDPKEPNDEDKKDPEAEPPEGKQEFNSDTGAWYLAKVGKHKLLSLEEEKELSLKIHGKNKARSEKAIEILVAHNLKLVVHIAKTYYDLCRNTTIGYEDLISEGNMGLHKAATRYRSTFGTRFSSYAGWWIRQHIMRCLSNNARTIRIPVHMVDKISKIRKVQALLTKELGKDPTPAEIAESLGISVTQVENLLKKDIHTLSLDSPSHPDMPDSTLGDSLADESLPAPGESLEKQNDRERLRRLIAKLPPMEQMVISQRFGLNGNDARTLEYIGSRVRLTRERIRQLQQKALHKLRRMIEVENARVDQHRNDAAIFGMEAPPPKDETPEPEPLVLTPQMFRRSLPTKAAAKKFSPKAKTTPKKSPPERASPKKKTQRSIPLKKKPEKLPKKTTRKR